jgi:hypothetical protein
MALLLGDDVPVPSVSEAHNPAFVADGSEGKNHMMYDNVYVNLFLLVVSYGCIMFVVNSVFFESFILIAILSIND